MPGSCQGGGAGPSSGGVDLVGSVSVMLAISLGEHIHSPARKRWPSLSRMDRIQPGRFIANSGYPRVGLLTEPWAAALQPAASRSASTGGSSISAVLISSANLGVFAVNAAGPGPRRGRLICSGVFAGAAVTAAGVSCPGSLPSVPASSTTVRPERRERARAAGRCRAAEPGRAEHRVPRRRRLAGCLTGPPSRLT